MWPRNVKRNLSDVCNGFDMHVKFTFAMNVLFNRWDHEKTICVCVRAALNGASLILYFFGALFPGGGDGRFCILKGADIKPLKKWEVKQRSPEGFLANFCWKKSAILCNCYKSTWTMVCFKFNTSQNLAKPVPEFFSGTVLLEEIYLEYS